MTELLTALISGLLGLLCAVLEARSVRDRRRAEERAKRRWEESRLAMELMSASCRLGVVTAKAVTHRQVNGDVEEAMSAAEKAQTEYDRFLRRLASQQASKV